MKLITPRRSWGWPDFRELWQFRELLWMLTVRDVKVRYKQTAIGVLWAVVQPVLTMVVFTLIFGKLGQMPSGGVPYPIFVFAALLPWQLFAKALTQGSTSMVALGGVMGKVYFPRLIAPLSAVLGGLIDFAIGFVVLAFLMAWFGVAPNMRVVFLPVFIGLALLAALSISLWLSAINTEYRDVQHAMPFITQIWMFLTPVIYPTGYIPQRWQALYSLNPMVSVIEGFRWCLLGGQAPDPSAFAISLASTAVLLTFGLLYFNKFEKSFVDRL
jgi:lipopolysaccharide transport system permease protein